MIIELKNTFNLYQSTHTTLMTTPPVVVMSQLSTTVTHSQLNLSDSSSTAINSTRSLNSTSSTSKVNILICFKDQLHSNACYMLCKQYFPIINLYFLHYSSCIFFRPMSFFTYDKSLCHFNN